MRSNTTSVAIALIFGICFHVSVHADESGASPSTNEQQKSQPAKSSVPKNTKLEKATFGLGCFSCAEAIFERVKGVHSVVVGYSGGHEKSPTHELVISGLSGHAEVVQVTYNPKIVSYESLLGVFWRIHELTAVNRKDTNVGSHYRSAVFYHTEEQGELAERSKEKLNASRALDGPVVTEIAEYNGFYPAAKHHQGFFRKDPTCEYCTMVIQPKVKKFEKEFADMLQASPSASAEQR